MKKNDNEYLQHIKLFRLTTTPIPKTHALADDIASSYHRLSPPIYK